MTNRKIVLDCDGILISYNRHYPKVWEKAFGKKLELVNPGHFHAFNEYDCKFKDDEEKQQFYAAFSAEEWAAMPVLEDAVDACNELVSMGYELICVTSMPDEFLDARVENFKLHNLPISETYAVGRDRSKGLYNPKKEILLDINPEAFVDDYGINFEGLENTSIHTALVHRQQPDSPNEQYLHLAKSVHNSLGDFVNYWKTIY